MKKVGILTFHRSHNYGAILQAYASLQALAKLGYKAELIDYMPESKLAWYDAITTITGDKLWDRVKIFLEKRIKKIVYPNSFNGRLEGYNKFNKFIETKLTLHKTEAITKFPNDLTMFDVIYIGSDQVWSRNNAAEGYCYFWGNLQGIKRDDAKVIAYAASMEQTAFEQNNVDEYRKYLKNFDSLSVREMPLKSLFQPLTNKSINVVLDPTLLVEQTIYRNIMAESCVEGSYLLIYRLSYDENIYKLAKRIAEKYNLQIVEISNRVKVNNKYKIMRGVDPAEFIRLFNDASFVVTNSFHGTTLSLIFEKPFYALNSQGKTRIESLLKQLDIADVCFVDNAIFPNLEQCKFDYSVVKEKLNKLKEASLEYLKQACDNN